jgi:hypothetical protein
MFKYRLIGSAFRVEKVKIFPNISATAALSFFRDYAQKIWPLRGSQGAGYLVTQSIGVRCQEGGSLNPET